MRDIFSCVNNVLIFILLVIPGYFCIRKKQIKALHIDGISTLLVNFLWPAMVIDAMNTTKITAELYSMALLTGVVCLAIYLLCAALFFLYWKIRRVDAALFGILAFGCTCNNTGYIGMPFIRSSLGKEALFIASIAEIVNDLIIFTVGLYLLQCKNSQKTSIGWRSMLSPGFISVFIGLFIFFLDIPLPSFLGQALGYMSDAITAIAMFVIGAQLGETDLRKAFHAPHSLELCLIRLILIPLAIFACLALLFPQHRLMTQVLTLMYGMPCAGSLAIFARQYGSDYHSATGYVMTSTVLLIFSLPLLSALVSLIP